MTDFTSRELRNVLGCFATGITVITTEKKGENFGITVNSFASVSLDPQEAVSNQFAISSTNKFSGVDYILDSRGIPMMKEFSSLLSCQTFETIEKGDHLIIIGRVIETKRQEGAKPLIFSEGKYAKLSD